MVVKRIVEEDDLQKAFVIRKEVFVDEQAVSLEEEFDEFDNLTGNCEHVLVFYNEQPVGTGRIRFLDEIGKLERICITQPYRNYGLGKSIIHELEEIAKENGVKQVTLHAQSHAEGFYGKLGYRSASDIFMEACIPHLVMTKEFR